MGYKEYRKAIAAAVLGVVNLLAAFGVVVEPGVSNAIISVGTVVAVWWFANEPQIRFDDQGRDSF